MLSHTSHSFFWKQFEYNSTYLCTETFLKHIRFRSKLKTKEFAFRFIENADPYKQILAKPPSCHKETFLLFKFFVHRNTEDGRGRPREAEALARVAELVKVNRGRWREPGEGGWYREGEGGHKVANRLHRL